MSAFGKNGRRCNGCGIFTKSKDGEYVREGRALYILPVDYYMPELSGRADLAELDFCDNCGDKDKLTAYLAKVFAKGAV
jgi:hypothetical protein